MGTLFDQPVRRHLGIERKDVLAFLEEVKELSKKLKLSVENVLEAYKIKEMERRNNLYKDNGDIFDEQMTGIGELIQELTIAIENIKEE